ncbi:MAG: trigger factor [Candidatus Angelobacter sp. Gp1-AA117]|nr:MAG: trigger factor [Candidatus Angelobacter sp. Gp1-AA117]
MNPVNTQNTENDNPQSEPVANEATETGSSAATEQHEEHAHDHAGHTHEEPQVDMRCVREITVDIPADVVSKQWDKTVQEYSKVARVPGFRKGKVPASVIRSRFGDDIRKDVFEALVPQHFREAVQKEGYRPVTEPRLLDLQMEQGGPLHFKAAFEILPEFELGSYQGIKFDKPEVTVTNEEIEAELKGLQERQANYDPVEEDRPLADGDYAQISFKATPKEEPQAASEQEGKPAEAEGQPVQMDEVLLEIGAPNTVKEFSDNLRGAKPGEERTFDVSYPAEYAEPRLAGKTITYSTSINGIKKKSVPELNDDFAKEVSQEFQTLDDLKKRICEGMEGERRHRATHEIKEKILDQLMERHDFPVPEVLVQHQIESRLERGLRALAAQGMSMEQMKQMDFRRLRAAQRDAAIKEVKSNLLLEKIADAEGIDANDEEIHREIQVLAQQTKQTPEALHQQYSQDGTLNEIRSRLRVAKALNFLYNSSVGETENTAA